MPDIFESITTEGFTALNYIICTFTALLCGVIAAVGAKYKNNISKSFIISLIVLAPIVETVIIIVNGNIGTSVAVMGAFSLIRFRSAVGKARDIASVFLVMTCGLACAGGYVAVALVLALLAGALMIALSRFSLGEENEAMLSITVPEQLNFTGAFDKVFEKYTRACAPVSVKTSNMGSLFKLKYRIELNDKKELKNFIDELRVLNGNLEISVSDIIGRNDEL